MSFGESDDEFLSIPLIDLLTNRESIINNQLLCSIIPEFSNYELKNGFRFEFSLTPIVFDVYIGERYIDGLRPNNYQLFDHLEIDPDTTSENDMLAFNERDYRIIKKLIV